MGRRSRKSRRESPAVNALHSELDRAGPCSGSGSSLPGRSGPARSRAKTPGRHRIAAYRLTDPQGVPPGPRSMALLNDEPTLIDRLDRARRPDWWS